MVYNVCYQEKKKNWCPKNKQTWYIQYRIDLPQWMSRFLLEVNGKFQFNSLIHCWAFCLKSWKRKWYLAVPNKSHHLSSYATLLDCLKKTQKKQTFLDNFGLADIFGCREAHKSIEVAHSSRLPWCRDCCERLGFRHICHCEWMSSEFTRKQSALASLSSRAKGHWG